MNLIITESIRQKEFLPLEKIFSLKIIQSAAQKALSGLRDSIKNLKKFPSTCLKKLYLTSTGGAGRVIFLLIINEKKSVLVMLRHKHDKKIGSNMTIQNPKFKKILEENLDTILKDLQHGRFEIYEI